MLTGDDAHTENVTRQQQCSRTETQSHTCFCHSGLSTEKSVRVRMGGDTPALTDLDRKIQDPPLMLGCALMHSRYF